MPEPDNRRTFGRYEVMRSLGRGAVGEVFLARDPALDRHVALKTLSGLEAMPPEERAEARARFLREARAAAGLSHPHIVTIHDVGETDGTPFLAMELLKATTLDRYVKPGHLLPPVKVLELGIQAALALDEAHRHGVIHRDVKPANLAFLEDGGLKVVDFGLAKGPEANLTAAETLLGTPNYMSPEQIAGQTLDGRSDLFSLAVSLFELLTGQRPFGGDTVSSVLYRIVNDPPLPLTRLRQDLPVSLEALLDRALAKSPADRLPSCGAFASEMGKILAQMGGVPASLRLPGPAETSAPALPRQTSEAAATRRRRWVPVVLASAVVVVLALAAWTTRLGEFLGLRPTEKAVLVTTYPPGLDVKVIEGGPAQYAAGRLVVPTAQTTPITLEAQDKCHDGTTQLLPRQLPDSVLVATKERVVNVRVASEPTGAAVVVDGKKAPDRTPLDISLRACDKHVVRLSAEGRKPVEVELRKDESDVEWRNKLDRVSLSVAAQAEAPRDGQVLFPAPPGYAAEVLVENGRRRLGAAGRKFTLPAGVHQLLAVNPEVLLSKRIEVRVKAGETTTAGIVWPRLGRLTVRTTPGDSRVFARSGPGDEPIELSRTPLNRVPVVAGDYDLIIEHPLNGKRVNRTVTVPPDADSETVRVGQEDWH